MPQARDVSVVIQGPVGPYLTDVLASVRRHLPGAELILSTWRGSAVDGLDADVVVTSADPGSTPYLTPLGTPSARLFNTNRLLRSTAAGLAAATRPFVLKLRTDSPLTASHMLDWWGRFERRTRDIAVFEHRILCPSIATRPVDRMPAYLFHPSDCVHFGTADDVRRLWAVPEIDEVANAAHWAGIAGLPQDSPIHGSTARFFNEQVLWLGCLSAHGLPLPYPHAGHLDADLAVLSELATANNFVVLEPWQLGVALPKLRPLVAASALGSYVWFSDWLASYTRFCGPVAAAA